MNVKPHVKAVEKISYSGHKNKEYQATPPPVLTKLEGQKNEKIILLLTD